MGISIFEDATVTKPVNRIDGQHHQPVSQPIQISAPKRESRPPIQRWLPKAEPEDLLVIPTTMNSQAVKTEETSSPATEALDYDANSLMFDLTELLKRDPTLSTLQTSVKDEPAGSGATATASGNVLLGSSSISNAMPIPSHRRDLIGDPSDVISTSTSDLDGVHTASSSVPPFGSSVGSAVSPLALSSNSPSLYAPASTPVIPPPNVTVPVASLGMPRVSSAVKMETDDMGEFDQQPTLAQLNASPVPPSAGILSSSSANDDLLKLELNDLDVDLNQYFINDSSRNVSFGAAAAYNSNPTHTGIRGKSVSFSSGTKPANLGAASRITQPLSAVHSGFLHQDDSMLFSSSSVANQSGGSTFIGAKDLLSSSVPASIFHNSPLSDILTDLPSTSGSSSVVGLNSPSVSPGLAGNSPSQAGPERNHHTQLHKLLLRKDPVGVASRPSPVRSPENRKTTLDKIRNNLSASNPMLTQQLSKSAPTTQQNFLDRMVWSRREPRQHISSVCSVGNDSSIADEVSEALNGISPSDLPDIESDDEIDEDDEEESGMAGKDSSDEEDSGDEGAPGTSAGSSSKGAGKKEKHFWQYNVQAKGPKGQKIFVETKIEDPHHLNEIVDPVFSGNVQMQGIKHR